LSTDRRFSRLLEPGRIGSMELKNRIIMAPMGTGYATRDGYVTDRMKNYYEARARGGVSLVIPGVVFIDAPRGMTSDCGLAISDDRFVPGLRSLVEVVHRHNARIAAQLNHGGKIATSDMAEGVAPLAPSPTTAGGGSMSDLTRAELNRMVTRFAKMSGDFTTREIPPEEIQRQIQNFAEAARRAKESGFDGVEIHAAHGYLLSSFLSPAYNKRQDKYGGGLENRARFLLEVIQAVRDRVGSSYPVWCRVDSREFGVDGGITIEDTLQLGRMLQNAGVDAIHVSGYGAGVRIYIDAPLVYSPGHLVPYAAQMKKTVTVPVIAVGRISPELGETVLVEGKADFIAMGRPLLADPELVNKLAAGMRSDIRPCLNCYQCISQHVENEPTLCAVNASTGKELEMAIKASENPRKIVVVGGGPAGMEAARVAAQRGHQVTLYEKTKRLGGSWFFASVMSRDNEDFLKWIKLQMKNPRIEVKLGHEVQPTEIETMRPDVTIVAVGPSLNPPQIPGADRRNVISGPELRAMLSGRDTAGKLPLWVRAGLLLARPVMHLISPSVIRWGTLKWLPLGQRVVVVGADLVGIEVAEFLNERGRKVTVLSNVRDLAPEMSIPRRQRVLAELREHGVTILTDVKWEEITSEGVIITTKKGERKTIEADTVIVAEGIAANPTFFKSLEGKLEHVYQIGDCAEVGLVRGALAEGTRIGVGV
jgi:2,4-dienoyl-CoA reductase-like NADH-dependent reductase (Old Yellow Enzyme family)/thioredoxin reductase